jgi:putative oxidoreductase
MDRDTPRDLFDLILDNEAFRGAALLVARLFMAAVFIRFGIGKIIHRPQRQSYMEAHGVPPELIYLAIVVQLGFGLMIALGYQTRFAALMLVGFCVIAPSLFHTDFSLQGEESQFYKDFAIAGGFLFVIANGPGPLSLDALRHRGNDGEASSPAED